MQQELSVHIAHDMQGRLFYSRCISLVSRFDSVPSFEAGDYPTKPVLRPLSTT